MTHQPDLFTHVQRATALRDVGMSLAIAAQDDRSPKWSERAYTALIELARHRSTVHIDDFLAWFPERPERPNASGSIWIRARRMGVLVPTGQMKPCKTDVGKHAHTYPLYKSTIYRAA